MDVIISKVYDKRRFAWFMHLKYKFPLSYTTMLSNRIHKEDKYSFTNLSESEIRYLQGNWYDTKTICKLKIINNIPRKMRNRPSIPPYLDNERKSCIDVSPQSGDEPKQDTLELFHVKFTKVIHYDEMLNERQIQALLKDNHVKSINVEK